MEGLVQGDVTHGWQSSAQHHSRDCVEPPRSTTHPSLGSAPGQLGGSVSFHLS